MVRSAASPIPLAPLLATVVVAVRQAAASAKRSERCPRNRARTRKGPGDFVTPVDLRCERLLRRCLLTALPEAGFLGEESHHLGLDRDFVWVVDPIDGTSNYANGIPHWAVAVALLHHRRPLMAVIWAEPEGAIYTAIRGHGARRNGRRLARPVPAWDDGSVVGCQWLAGDAGPLLDSVQSEGARVRNCGSTVLQILDVACGRLDANIQAQGRIWDLAAPSLVLEEVGGSIREWSGRPVFPSSQLDGEHRASLAAMPRVHRALRQRIRKLKTVVPRA